MGVVAGTGGEFSAGVGSALKADRSVMVAKASRGLGLAPRANERNKERGGS